MEMNLLKGITFIDSRDDEPEGFVTVALDFYTYLSVT